MILGAQGATIGAECVPLRSSVRPEPSVPAPIYVVVVRSTGIALADGVGRHFSPSERAEYATLPPRRRVEWVASRLALKLAGYWAGSATRLRQLEVRHDRLGRPVVSRLAGRRCSLAHAAGAGAAAVSAGLVGIDLEPAGRFDHGFGQRIASEGEMALMAASGVPARARPTLLWTVKEAVLKATGRGLSVDPRRVRLTASFGADWGVRFDDPAGTPTRWRVTSVARRGLRLAIARPLFGEAG